MGVERDCILSHDRKDVNVKLGKVDNIQKIKVSNLVSVWPSEPVAFVHIH